MKNMRLYMVVAVLMNLVTFILSGGIQQTFLLEYGFSEETVNLYSAVGQLLGSAAIILCSSKADKTKNVIRAMALLRFMLLPSSIFLIFLCFFPLGHSFAVTSVLFLTGAILFIALGVDNVLAYKVPYLIMDMKNYGRALSVSGILVGVISFLFTGSLSLLYTRFSYPTVTKWIYVLTAPAVVVLVFVILGYRQTQDVEDAHKTRKKSFSLLRYKPFTRLILPNLMRGFGMGMSGLGITIGYYTGILNAGSSSVLVTVGSGISILAAFIMYVLSAKHISGRLTLLVSCIGAGVAFPFLGVGASPAFYIAANGLLTFFVSVIGFAVPITVAEIVDYDISGEYSGGRMLLTNAGSALAGFSCIFLFRLIGVMPTLCITALFSVLSGIGYYIFTKKT